MKSLLSSEFQRDKNNRISGRWKSKITSTKETSGQCDAGRRSLFRYLASFASFNPLSDELGTQKIPGFEARKMCTFRIFWKFNFNKKLTESNCIATLPINHKQLDSVQYSEGFGILVRFYSNEIQEKHDFTTKIITFWKIGVLLEIQAHIWRCSQPVLNLGMVLKLKNPKIPNVPTLF